MAADLPYSPKVSVIDELENGYQKSTFLTNRTFKLRILKIIYKTKHKGDVLNNLEHPVQTEGFHSNHAKKKEKNKERIRNHSVMFSNMFWNKTPLLYLMFSQMIVMTHRNRPLARHTACIV